MDSGLKVCEKVNIGPSTFSVLHFLSLYIFSILFRYKILFFLFSFHVLERRKRESLDFDRIKKKKSWLTLFKTMKNIKHGVNEFHLIKGVWWWLFWVSMLPKRTNIGQERKFLPNLIWHFESFFVFLG
jgi:hypothetical protein